MPRLPLFSTHLGVAVLLAVAPPFLVCEIVRCQRRQKKILDEYAENGILVSGVILKVKTYIRRERPPSYAVVFAYKTPPGFAGAGEILVKPPVHVSSRPSNRRVQVLVLPGLPHSGCLKETVDQRSGVNTQRLFLCVFLLVLHLAGIIFLMSIIFTVSGSVSFPGVACLSGTYFLPAVVSSSVALHAVSFLFAECTFRCWRTKLLYSSSLLRGDPAGGGAQARLMGTARAYEPVSLSEDTAEIPTAEVVAILEGQDEGDVSLDTLENGGVASVVAVAAPAQDHCAEATVVQVEATSVVQLSFFEPGDGDASAQSIREAVQAGDWLSLRDFFAGIRGKNVERDFCARVISSCLEEVCWKESPDTFGPVLDRWVEEEPNNPDCSLIRGWCCVSWAWFARGSGFANTVPPGVWPKFHARIDQASHELQHTIKLCPTDGLAFALLIVVARAEKGRDTAKVVRFVEGLQQSDDAHNLMAHKQLLQFHCRKWGGSDDEMFAFARESVRGLPEGDPLWILIVMAHHEVFLQIIAAASATRRPVLIGAALKYWSRPEVKQEVLHSYQQYVGSSKRRPTATAAEESILLSARNWYAYSFIESGNFEMARRELLSLGRRPTAQPWNTLRRFQEACNKAGVSL